MELLENTSQRIAVALFLLTLTQVSAYFNTLVLIDNFKKPNRIARNLYIGLAIADLTACVVGPINACFRLLGNEDLTLLSEASTDKIVIGILVWSTTFAPCVITGFLAMTRYYSIRYPLGLINHKLVYTLVILGVLYMPSVLSLVFSLYSEHLSFIPAAMNIWISKKASNSRPNPTAPFTNANLFFIASVLPMLTQISAIITSLLTIIELGKRYLKPMSTNSQRSSLKGSIKIIIANAGSVLLLVFMVLTASFVLTSNSSAVLFNFSVVIPAVTSAGNPLIYVLLTPSARQLVIRKSRVRSSDAGNRNMDPSGS